MSQQLAYGSSFSDCGTTTLNQMFPSFDAERVSPALGRLIKAQRRLPVDLLVEVFAETWKSIVAVPVHPFFFTSQA